MKKVNIKKELAALDEYWSQRVIGHANDTLVKVAKGAGQTNWHRHDDQDEGFIVYKGSLRIQLRSETVELNEGDMFVVPRGVEHRVCAGDTVKTAEFLLLGINLTSNEEGGKPAWSYT